MRISQAWLIARHDLGLFRRRRATLYALVALPLAVAVGFPLLVRYILTRAGHALSAASLPGLIDSFGFWFVISAAMLPTAIASYSIVGEKTEKSLEPLLATPTTDGEILFGKALAALVPTVGAIAASSVIFMVIMDRVTEPTLGYLYYPNWAMAVILLALAPLACLLTIELSILVSSRVTDVRSAQQISGLVFLPFILLYLAGEVGILVLDATHLLYVAAALAGAVLLMYFVSRGLFRRDEILTRWR